MKGANPNHGNKRTLYAPIHFASFYGDVESLKLLL